MSVIRVLPPQIANQIAAGEVVERPSSAVKELVENALDAGATAVTVEIENGGIDLIRVTDNGFGIAREDCETAFLRHATSKIAVADDLFHISTLGFRGEALSSIAAVSAVTLTTRTASEETGTRLTVDNGAVRKNVPVAATVGTSIEVCALFASVPARLKFLKNPRTESGYIGDYVTRMMMARPDIAFHFINNGKTVYQTYGDGKLINAIVAVYGTGLLPHLAEVLLDDGYLRVAGCVGTSEISRQNRMQQSFFINGRYIRSFALSNALQYAFDTRIMSGRFPFAVLNLTISHSDVDVNVHPTKMEVRFVDEQRVLRAVTAACANALVKKAPAVLQQAAQPVSTFLGAAGPKPAPGRHLDLRAAWEQRPPAVREGTASTVARPAGLTPGGVQRYAIASARPPAPAPIKSGAADEPSAVSGGSMQDAPPPAALKSEQQALSDAPFSIAGVLFDTYWIVQRGEDIFYIDQHAAHERKLYEQLMHHEAELVSQKLLSPLRVTLPPLEYAALAENIEAFAALGFGVSFPETGEDGACELTALPQIGGAALPERALFDALHQITEFGSTSDKRLVREAIIQVSCKHAIKAGERIGRAEIEELLAYYARDGAPLTCPHGRPVFVHLTRHELEKLFKRVS